MKTITVGGYAAVFLSAMAAAGCGSSDSSNVPARCDETAQSLCDTNANCSVETGEITSAQRPEFVANCLAGFKQSLDCSRTTQITGNPDACESELAATPCAQYVPNQGLPLPASCYHIYK